MKLYKHETRNWERLTRLFQQTVCSVCHLAVHQECLPAASCVCCLSLIARYKFRRTVLTFKPKCCCISVVYLLVLCGCLSVLEEKMCPISHVLCSKQLTTTLASVTTLCPFERWCSACSTRGFLPDWLHSICSADKDAVLFCEILVPEASYLIDFTVYAVQTKMRCRFVKY